MTSAKVKKPWPSTTTAYLHICIGQIQFWNIELYILQSHYNPQTGKNVYNTTTYVLLHACEWGNGCYSCNIIGCYVYVGRVVMEMVSALDRLHYHLQTKNSYISACLAIISQDCNS